MKQIVINNLYSAINKLQELKKSEMKLSERIKIEQSIIQIRISIEIIQKFNVQSFNS